MTEEETAENLQENAYMQYLVGLHEFHEEALFDLPLAAHKVTVRDKAGLKTGPVISARILAGWKGVKNGLGCRELALFSAKLRKMVRKQNRLTTARE